MLPLRRNRLEAVPVWGWGGGGRGPTVTALHVFARNMFGFEGMMDKVDVEVMITIGGGLLIASLFLMFCFLCLYCKLASTLR